LCASKILLQCKKVSFGGEKCNFSPSTWRQHLSQLLNGPQRAFVTRFFTVFKGVSSISLDAKGRLAVPTRYRDVLTANAAGQLTITRHPDGCLLLFARPEWDRFSERVAALPMTAQWWKRIFLGSAMDVELDSTGRVLISPELRQAAGLSKDVMLMGMGSHFELWDKATHDAKEAQALQGDMPDVFKDFSF
jgi:MraZ protein